MPQTGTCPRGHDWDGHPDDCPVCAGDEESLDEKPGSTIHSSSDELPPLPGSVRRPVQSSLQPASAAATPGSILIPGYEVLEELGHGGMGTVYRARQLSLNRLVALKVISAGEASGTREIERFRAEAEAIARLQHPHIVQVYEVGEASGRPYLALELVEGGTLAHALAGRPLAARAAAQLLEVLARAIQYAHERGVIHRDLKPGNILLQPSETGPDPGIPKVADFGLARRADVDSAQTTTGVVVGTPSYMAPEQAAGLSHLSGQSCDIYALGAILYELLTGRPPFHASTPIETLQQVVSLDPISPSRLQPRLPRDLETICLKCLQKVSRKRYGTAGELADDLRRFLDGKPILARRTTAIGHAIKWARRRKAAAALIAVSILAAAALSMLGLRYNRTLERHNAELTQAASDLKDERDEARRQKDRAEINLESANEAIEQMLTRVGFDRLSSAPFMDRTRIELLEDALRFFDKLLAAQTGDARLRLQRAHTLELAGCVNHTLGRFAQARQYLDAALALIEQLRAEPGNPVPAASLLWLQARALSERSLVRAQSGEAADARADQDAAISIREQLLKLEPTNTQYEFALAASYLNRAMIAKAEQKPQEVELFLGRARPRAEALTRDHGDVERHWHLLGLVLNDLGVHCLEANERDRAFEIFERSVAIWRKLVAADAGNVNSRTELARSLTNLSTVLRMQKYLRRAEEPIREAIAIRERLAADHPNVWSLDVGLASSWLQLGELHRARRESDLAHKQFTSIITRLEPSGDRLRNDGRARAILTDAYIGRANTHDANGKPLEMAEALKRAIQLIEPGRRADLRMTRAVALAFAGSFKEALSEAEDVLKAPESEADILFNGARVYALASSQSGEPNRKEELETQAVRLLERIARAGYFRGQAGLLNKSNDFKSLQGRKDFESLRQKVNPQ